MTREEAVEILKAWDLNWDEEYSAHEFDVAFNMAINALQTEPCNDCISRQRVLDIVEFNRNSYDGNDAVVWIEREIKELPSVQPEPFINKPCVSEQACHEDKVKVLEKIKAEIEAKCCITVGRECDGAITLHDVFEIIDKYKAESEDKE